MPAPILSTIDLAPAPSPGDAGLLSAAVFDGLAPDAALAALGDRVAGVRLVFPARDPKRCCDGHQPLFIAINADDPGLTELEIAALSALEPGRAVPGCGLRALTGGIVALPGLSLDLAPARDLGPGLDRVVILTLADAARGLTQAGPESAMAPWTVVLLRGEEMPPAPWRAASEAGRRVALAAGLPRSVADRIAA